MKYLVVMLGVILSVSCAYNHEDYLLSINKVTQGEKVNIFMSLTQYKSVGFFSQKYYKEDNCSMYYYDVNKKYYTKENEDIDNFRINYSNNEYNFDYPYKTLRLENLNGKEKIQIRNNSKFFGDNTIELIFPPKPKVLSGIENLDINNINIILEKGSEYLYTEVFLRLFTKEGSYDIICQYENKTELAVKQKFIPMISSKITGGHISVINIKKSIDLKKGGNYILKNQVTSILDK